jgi:leucyl/phenylalanyl-tRNA--protein transferase
LIVARIHEIEWFSPDPRAIIPLGEFNVPHGLRCLLQKKTFEICINTSFPEVIHCCARCKDTWIDLEVLASYTRFAQAGLRALGGGVG